ncbi:hypothetical protein BV898_09039 [Hypsibius exemplaris]|uniref:Uncharacterized protein n=1 Tax=Hypsibius exemplaris TaxID=2072580 RepID=A0A1W0WNY6_HYPEX|nr:hypothetical protein BV898_09039 [Hypsibius exemplaris]
MSHHQDKHDLPVMNNAAALPGQLDGQEFKYERVETAKVDADGNAVLVDAREDRGHEDPGMNFQDKRPAVPPGTPIGVVSSTVSGMAPQMPLHSIPGPFIDPKDQVITSTTFANAGGAVRETDRVSFSSSGTSADRVSLASSGSSISPSVLKETTTIREKKIENFN